MHRMRMLRIRLSCKVSDSRQDKDRKKRNIEKEIGRERRVRVIEK